MISLNGAAAFETVEFMAARIDEFGTPDGLQPLRGGLGARHEHARTSGPSRWPPTSEGPATGPSSTGRRASRQGRGPSPVPPHHRRGPDRVRGGRYSRADVRERYRSRSRCTAFRWPTAFDDADRRRAQGDPVLRDGRATGVSTTRAGQRSPGTASRGTSAPSCLRWTTTCGSSTTPRSTGPRLTMWPPNIPTSSPTSSACCSSRR